MDLTNNSFLNKKKPDNGSDVFLPSKILIKTCKININKEKISRNKIGLKLIERDPGTADHSPKGILITYGKENFLPKSILSVSAIVNTTDIAPLILKLYGIKPFDYMNKIEDI